MSIDFLSIDVEELLPHAGDMVLIDRITGFDEDSGTSTVKVSADSKFFEPEINGIHGLLIQCQGFCQRPAPD